MLPAEPRTRHGAWFPHAATPAEAPRRLVCLPYAGGTASVYRDWQEQLGDGVRVVPVQPPGRGLRLREDPHTALEPLVTELVDALSAAGLSRDYALFGHSMGALLAYEVACALRERGEAEPLHLFVSGSRAPHLFGDRADHSLPDQDLWRLVSDLGGLAGNREVSQAYFARRLPILRADLRVCETYRWQPRAPLSCPMTAFSASGDGLASAAQVEAWSAYTTSSFLRRHVDGGHFFLNGGPPRERLLRELRGDLNRLGSGQGAGPESDNAWRNAPWTY